MAERDLSPLSLQIVRGLNDKLYEKRKTAALEIERYYLHILFFNVLFFLWFTFITLGPFDIDCHPVKDMDSMAAGLP